jgi:hypothetical protein
MGPPARGGLRRTDRWQGFHGEVVSMKPYANLMTRDEAWPGNFPSSNSLM